MANENVWVAVVIAGVGMIGTVSAGVIGYQSGSKAVDKDYVQMAINNLGNKQASPDLRRWSVQILNKLAPVPISDKLQEQLVVAPSVRLITPTIALPTKLLVKCPAVTDKMLDSLVNTGEINDHNEAVKKLALDYEECRLKQKGMADYLSHLHNSTAKLNIEKNGKKP